MTKAILPIRFNLQTRR